jgi:hypothetical protein
VKLLRQKSQQIIASVVLSAAMTATLLPANAVNATAVNAAPKNILQANMAHVQQVNISVSRAEFLKGVVDALKLPLKDTSGSAFGDTRNHWIEKRGYIDAAIKAGLIAKGRQFHPNSPISRQAAATILMRAIRTKHKLAAANHVPPYLDGSSVDKAFYSDINWATWLGLLSGTNSRLQPSKSLTQSEMKAMIAKLQNIIKQKELPAPAIFPLSEVKPGMLGVIQTVIRGQQIESIPVRVIDIIPGQGLDGSAVILVRGTGDVLNRAHGFASGMSGSPLYFNGKIAGAVALAFPDEKVAGVTPIEAMLKGLPAAPKTGQLNLEKPLTIQGKIFSRLEITAKPEAVTPQPGTLTGYHLPVPLMVSGFHGSTLSRIQNIMEKKGIPVLNAGSSSGNKAAAKSLGRPLQPGDAMGVALATGDLEAYAIGTVTYVDNQRLLGFGHPLFWYGNVNLPITEAWISTVMKGAVGLLPPYKIGYIGKTVGTLTEDRATAVGGVLGEKPQTIPMTISTKDINRGTNLSLKLNLANEKDYLISLAPAAASEGILRAVDRIGQGTSYYTIQVNTEELGTITRSDTAFDNWDVSYTPYSSIYRLMDILLNNPYQQVTIKEIRFNSEVKQTNNSANLISAEPKTSGDTVKQGDIITVTVTVQPWRQQPYTIDIPVQIPEDLAPGLYEVRIYGGANTNMGGYYIDPYSPNGNQPESLQEMIDEYVKAPKGNDIVFEFVSPGMEPEVPPVEALDDTSGDTTVGKPNPANNNEISKPVRVTYSTSWVISGMLPETLTIQVEPGPVDQTPEEEPAVPADETDTDAQD